MNAIHNIFGDDQHFFELDYRLLTCWDTRGVNQYLKFF